MRKIALKCIATVGLWFLAAFAVSPATANEDAILTLSNGSGASQAVDRAWLEGLPRTTIETSTIWTEGVHSFEGVALNALLNTAGLDGTTIRATALNDYSVDIPVADAIDGGPIVAYRMNGNVMSVRDKGPLWIVYPYDSRLEYRSEVIYSRSIWQLTRIEVFD